MEASNNSEKPDTEGTKMEDESASKEDNPSVAKDELDSILDDALDDFDKYQSSSVDPVDHEKSQANTATSQETDQSGNPELPPLPVDQEAFFNAVFNNPESQQMFSGMNEAFAGLMSGFEQMAHDPELKNEMDQLMQNMMGAGATASEPPKSDSSPPRLPPRPPQPAAEGDGEDLARTLGETMQKLAESAKDIKDGNIPQEDIMKAFENLNMEGGDQVLLPMVQNMMESLLSKDVLYPSLKEVTDKYPQWLEENKSRLPESDYERYCKQQGTMYRVCQEYEEEKDTDSVEVKKDRIMRIMNLIQEMESYGEPPKEIVGDMQSPGLQFDERGLPKIPGMPSGEQCSVM